MIWLLPIGLAVALVLLLRPKTAHAAMLPQGEVFTSIGDITIIDTGDYVELSPIRQGLKLRSDAAAAFNAMDAAASAMGVDLRLTGQAAAYRTEADQLRMLDERPEYAAPVGKSKHQKGTAVDIDVLDDVTGKQNDAGKWLVANAARFGFKNTVAREPWHWEYVA